MTRALVREPGEDIARCELTWIDRESISLEPLRAAHADYVRILRDEGVDVQVLPALDGHPDAPFVEDAVVVLPEFIVLGRSTVPLRRAELASLIPFLPTDRPRLRLPSGATLDGGDVLVVGRDVLVGLSTRSNRHAVRVMADALPLGGYRIHPIPVSGVLHLKTAVTAASSDVLVARPGALDMETLRLTMGSDREVIMVPEDEPTGANVLALPSGGVLMSASAPKTARMLRDRGLQVHSVDLREFEKAEAGPTCLSILW